MKSSINTIKLIYPPISNRFGGHLWDNNQEVRGYLKQSKLYMLAQRKQLFLANHKFNETTQTLNFSFTCGDTTYNDLSVDLSHYIDTNEETIIELGGEIIKIYSSDVDTSVEEPTYWATPDKLLWDHSKGRVKIIGDFNPHELSNFYLYYVGISKENDSFTRLFKNGHKNRTNILSNEQQFSDSARLSDEIMIFFFDSEELRIAQYEVGDDNFLDQTLSDKKDVIADAEKAFIKVLDCKYNKEKYANYPQCRDGLYNKELSNYSYHIGDDINFIAPKANIKGRVDIFAKPDYDFIMISGEDVTLFKGEELMDGQT
jgi:hypothetical protein